ncbi:NlpC/P60 family protein [Mycobacterium sp. pUA109]|uniref:NlpC/P60 family protein n=1 Tax=Mycobacterium sp. pUA109 TaxID=3238982 RepID=UPI00351B31BE
MTADLTFDEVRLWWDPAMINEVFRIAHQRAATMAKLGDNLVTAQRFALEHWGGEAAEAFHAEAGKHRSDIEADGQESKRVAAAIGQAENDIRKCQTEAESIYQTAKDYGWTVTPSWKIDTGDVGTIGFDDSMAVQEQLLQDRLNTLNADAHTADHELATALRAAVGEVQLDEQGHEVGAPPQPHQPDQNPGAPVAGPDGHPPYANGAQPTMIPGAKTIPLADNPPGFPPVGPGAQRDHNWQQYLNGFNADGSRRVQVGTPPAALPKPEAVQDRGLRAIGAAGRQQGVSYAWGANHSVQGPSKGTLAGDPPDGGAHQYHDDQRIGFDCGGLVRFSEFQATGHDVFQRSDGLDSGAGTDRIDKSASLSHVDGGDGIPSARISSVAQPGDVLVFEIPGSGHEPYSGTNTQHTGIYVGNGFMINAPESGEPIRLDNADRDGRRTDILRPKP